jgi:hypothetical protein
MHGDQPSVFLLDYNQDSAFSFLLLNLMEGFAEQRNGTILRAALSVCAVFLVSFALSAQGFNPYNHSYQGWDGDELKSSSPIGNFLNKFSLNVHVGYGRTFYSHSISSDVLEIPHPEFTGGGNTRLIILDNYRTTGNELEYQGTSNWLNAPKLEEGVVQLYPSGPGRILNAGSSAIEYAGSGSNIPINFSLHLDVNKFRIGGGVMYELHSIKKLKPTSHGVRDYIPDFKSTFMLRYYFTAGAKVYHLMGWDYNIDVQIGKVQYDNKYDKSRLTNGIFFNLGLPFEFEMSEYFWLVVRPSFDFKSYNMALAANGEAPSIQHNQPAFYLNFGVRMKIPEIKRCPVKACQAQLKHAHGGKEFRGQPFYQKQNPKIGETRRRSHRKQGKKGTTKIRKD